MSNKILGRGTRRHEQGGNLLVLGTFGPTVAAILLSYRGVRVPGSKLFSRFVCFSLALLLCWAVLMGHASSWDGLHLSFGTKLLLLLPSIIPAWIVSAAFSRDCGVRATMRTLLLPRPVVWRCFYSLRFCFLPQWRREFREAHSINPQPSPTDKSRRYLHSIHHPEKPFGEARVTLSPTRGLAKPFDRLTLARAYADFVNRVGGVAEFCIVLEAGRVLDGPGVPKVGQGGGLKSYFKAHSEFTWE